MIMLSPNRPINWKNKLNKGLVCWWLAIPSHARGGVWRDLCGKLNGTLNLLEPGKAWVGPQGNKGIYGAIRIINNGPSDARRVSLHKFDSNVLELSNPGITIFTVVKLNLNQFSKQILVKANTGAAPAGFGFGIDDSTHNKIKWYTGNGSTGNNLVSRSALVTNYWYTVCVTHANLGTKSIYINGELEISASATNYSIAYAASGGSLAAIGGYLAGGNQYLENADIASLMVYNRPLNNNEAKLLHLSSKNGYKSQLNFINPKTICSGESGGIVLSNYIRRDFRGVGRGIYRGAGRGTI